ncbi:MAG: T4 prohead core scaffold protein [Euryarchaeota archaeon TMED129]|nr:MAG: T4 prohead core scaffold protein [Euryarchaeota archaeon TMED129]|tara:strand:- start:104 stop:1249 length:1146 start_codon:yes stop_codon:yes gene_type:complete
MSSGKNLQEMEVKTQQSRTAVNAGAKPADPMPKLTTGGTPASYEDLGGPTPENYKVDDDSAKLKTPGGTLKQVKDVVNKGAKPADAMKGMKEEEEVSSEETIEEEEATTDEVVAEAETTEDEVVSEEEVTTEEEVVAEYDVQEDIDALIAGEELSEEFQEKAKTIFEAAINAKVAQIKEQLEAENAQKFAEEVAAAKESLAERVDSYLEYVSDEWFEENSLAVEAGLKTEMTESFLAGMKGLFEEHYVTIPEEKYDVLESMVEKLDDMETKLNEQIEKNVSLNARLSESVADGILDDVSEGLASTQKEKLASLAESVEFESEDQYRGKLETLKESYFNSKKETSSAKTETLSEGVDNSAAGSVSDSMAAYMRTLGSFSNKN